MKTNQSKRLFITAMSLGFFAFAGLIQIADKGVNWTRDAHIALTFTLLLLGGVGLIIRLNMKNTK